MKKVISLVLILVLALALVAFAACGEDPNPNPGPNPGGKSENVHENEDYTGAGIVAAGSKIYLTSFGQADYSTLKTLVTGAKYANVTVPTEQINDHLMAADVEAGSTVVCVAGYAAKGLATGDTQATETARAQAFAARSDINLVLIHVGGEARRGENSDPMCKAIAPKAKFVLVSDDNSGTGGNIKFNGENFETWCGTTVPLYIFEDEGSFVPSLKAILATK